MQQDPLNYDSAAALRALLEALGLGARKRWGQNFLINRGAREKIVRALEIAGSEEVWEIGPGLGAMTALLLDKARLVRVFEIDPAFQTILEKFFGNLPQFSLVKGDVLKTWQDQSPQEASIKVLGNLPYNIAGAILQRLMRQPITLAAITVQKEMAQRMAARPKSKEYASFSVWCQLRFNLQLLGDLKPASFYPQPRVDSSIVRLQPKTATDAAVLTLAENLAKQAFASRRKTLRNNLHAPSGSLQRFSGEELLAAFQQSGAPPSMRAEELEPPVFLQAAAALIKPAPH